MFLFQIMVTKFLPASTALKTTSFNQFYAIINCMSFFQMAQLKNLPASITDCVSLFQIISHNEPIMVANVAPYGTAQESVSFFNLLRVSLFQIIAHNEPITVANFAPDSTALKTTSFNEICAIIDCMSLFQIIFQWTNHGCKFCSRWLSFQDPQLQWILRYN